MSNPVATISIYPVGDYFEARYRGVGDCFHPLQGREFSAIEKTIPEALKSLGDFYIGLCATQA